MSLTSENTQARFNLRTTKIQFSMAWIDLTFWRKFGGVVKISQKFLDRFYKIWGGPRKRTHTILFPIQIQRQSQDLFIYYYCFLLFLLVGRIWCKNPCFMANKAIKPYYYYSWFSFSLYSHTMVNTVASHWESGGSFLCRRQISQLKCGINKKNDINLLY